MLDEFSLDGNAAWRRSALGRVPRPRRVEICSKCGKPVGMNYPACERCFPSMEELWLADWRALLERENIANSSADERLLAQVVMDEWDRHPFTILDIAMTLQRCKTCQNELGSRYRHCTECALAFGAALAAEYGVSGNAHAIHIGRWILRHAHQHSDNIVMAWRYTVPRLLTGWLPGTEEAQRWMNKIKAGEIAQVERALQSLDREINCRSVGD
ncbi:MAG TPA: hypothetical protein VKQ72_10825 [Aggregatilineales bacterium]|nr:hypothetical protein [Aggregatilineales bacterium]